MREDEKDTPNDTDTSRLIPKNMKDSEATYSCQFFSPKPNREEIWENMLKYLLDLPNNALDFITLVEDLKFFIKPLSFIQQTQVHSNILNIRHFVRVQLKLVKDIIKKVPLKFPEKSKYDDACNICLLTAIYAESFIKEYSALKYYEMNQQIFLSMDLRDWELDFLKSRLSDKQNLKNFVNDKIEEDDQEYLIEEKDDNMYIPSSFFNSLNRRKENENPQSNEALNTTEENFGSESGESNESTPRSSTVLPASPLIEVRSISNSMNFLGINNKIKAKKTNQSEQEEQAQSCCCIIS